MAMNGDQTVGFQANDDALSLPLSARPSSFATDLDKAVLQNTLLAVLGAGMESRIDFCFIER
jgi:hypothetical protein